MDSREEFGKNKVKSSKKWFEDDSNLEGKLLAFLHGRRFLTTCLSV